MIKNQIGGALGTEETLSACRECPTTAIRVRCSAGRRTPCWPTAFALDHLGAPYLTFSPRAYGIDFYGDALCTSARQLKERPERVWAFRSATLKGWKYALSHKEELVDLILRRYSQRKGHDALLFEAIRTEALIQPDLIELGYLNAQHWKNIADTYRDLGMLSRGSEPEWQIFPTDKNESPGWLKYALVGLALLGLLSVLVWLCVTLLGDRLKARLGTPTLSVVMSVLFVCLSIPILIFILLYNYRTNSAAILSTLREEVAKTNQASIENTVNLIQPVASTLRLLAGAVATDPVYFRTEASRDVLYQALTSTPQIDAAYVSFEDGYHRVVTRIDDDRRRSDPLITPTANWHSSYIDEFSAGKDRARHRTFFDTWPHVVGRSVSASTMDIRTLPGYQAAKEWQHTTDRYRLNIRKRKPLGANWSTGTRASDGRAPASAVPNSSPPDRD